ncbi:MAG: M36 family metallopeptidase [Gaiellaceae bacterium]
MIGLLCRRFALILAVFAVLPAAPALAIANVRDSQQGLPDVDARTGAVVPTSAQTQLASSLGAHATWNRFGTPQSLIHYGGYLATGLSGDPVAAAKSFISTNKALFRLTDQGVANLQLVNDSPLVGSAGHAVVFRQTFGGLAATQDGLITVGVVGGKIAYVSSSAAGDGNAPGAPTLTAAQAWVLAAQNVGKPVSLVSVLSAKADSKTGWTGLHVAGFDGFQRVRLTALPTYTQGVRPAYEAIVLDGNGGTLTGYREFVDAQSGAVLFRYNGVQQLADNSRTAVSTLAAAASSATCDPTNAACTFSNDLPVTLTRIDCGPPEGPFTAGDGTKSVDVEAGEDVVTNDVVLNLYRGLPGAGNSAVASSDTLFSPEAIHYEPQGGVPSGDYYAQVCPFDSVAANYTAPYTYHGVIAMNTAAGTQPLANTPKWKAFLTNPPTDYSANDNRQVACWLDSLSNLTAVDSDCNLAVANVASRAPWDFNFQAHEPTFTTLGNNAVESSAWVDGWDDGQLIGSFGPGAPGEQPRHLDRNYNDPWTNAWYTSKCDPSILVPGGADVLAAATNLFTGHNRMHDFAYNLGFTETNYNAQLDNFGNTAPGPYPNGREDDLEEGNVQAGAINGGAPFDFTGRDNANQLTLNDGIPPITNQYLFQPIAGSFYAPCVDGDMDTSIFAHEYTHLISNRMAGGPDSSLSGYQAGAMGESWSDLDALEYQAEYNYAPDPFIIGAYATGNATTGIRDYAVDKSPLNYSDLGFDIVGPEPHADGEIWNATNYTVRQALVDKYDGTYPYGDLARQKACADGKYAADACPGNRRWIQIVYDAWLLDAATVSMLDARDAYLAADVMRFGGANQTELWRAFAQRGMGSGASSNTNTDSSARPSFESPAETNATVTFNAVAADEAGAAVPAKIYVGRYEDRAVPIADTNPATSLPNTAKFVPGTYDFIVQAAGYGLTRFTQTFTATATPVTFKLQTNWASSAKGASVSGDGDAAELAKLVDDTENTNWTVTGRVPSAAGTQATVAFPAAHSISSVRVSAMLGPGQPRFTALRSFGIDACNSATTDCSVAANYTRVYTSPDDAFPGVKPRPTAPTLIIRTFSLPQPVTATNLRLVVLTNQCLGMPGVQVDSDNDPTNDSGCITGSTTDSDVRVAELEAFGAPPAPDLQVTTLTAAKSGGGFVYKATVSNTGNDAAGASITQLKLDGVQVCAAATGALAAGGSTTVSCTTKPKVGTHTLVATADSAGAVAESDEANNTKSITFKS